jgi:tRNA G18 (ribose-2'-O)-methylase SpoU
VYCTGYTPSPIDRFGKINSAIAKTALGAEQTVLWQQRKSIGALVKKLHREGVVIVGVEQSAHAQPVAKFKQPRRTAYLFGNEVDGLSINDQAFCDAIIELPMMGKKESLNVSAAAAIVLYRSLI